MHDVNAKATQVIDKAVNFFLERIGELCDKDSFSKPRTQPAAFSIFKPANEAFYEYAYYERTLEWFTRDLLINPILKGLFQIHNVETAWPDVSKHIRYSTEAIENIYPFEFIIFLDKEKVGVRYTSLCAGDSEKLARQYAINRIIQISWSDEMTFWEKEREEYEIISPETFFVRYFTWEEYDCFFTKAMSAVKQANAEIGFATIPRLSLRYLSNFKMETDNKLQEKEYEKLSYQILPGSKWKEDLSQLHLNEEDYDILNENFKSKELYKALFGKAGFAKCFITAEYLYNIFCSGNSIDYTSVACGYFKFVEQLLHRLTQIRLKHSYDEDLWIKCRSLSKKQRKKLEDKDVLRWNPDPKFNVKQILHKEEYEPYFDITLGSLTYFVNNDKKGWYVSDRSREIVHEFLRNFTDECRNGYLHKDNIDVRYKVTCIRDNALLLAYILLGGYKLSGNHQEDLAYLEITDDFFDRLYKQIQQLPRGIKKFIIRFSGKDPIKAYRYYEQDLAVYNENGSVSASQIKFVAVDNFSGDEYDKAMQGKYSERKFVLDRSNMPVQISYINGKNEEVLISW